MSPSVLQMERTALFNPKCLLRQALLRPVVVLVLHLAQLAHPLQPVPPGPKCHMLMHGLREVPGPVPPPLPAPPLKVGAVGVFVSAEMAQQARQLARRVLQHIDEAVGRRERRGVGGA